MANKARFIGGPLDGKVVTKDRAAWPVYRDDEGNRVPPGTAYHQLRVARTGYALRQTDEGEDVYLHATRFPAVEEAV